MSFASADRRLPPLHVVTDDRVLAGEDFGERARAVLEAGGDGVALHLRGPGTPGRHLHDLAARLVPAARSAGALLLVNDRVDVARVVEAHGVQLGERSLPVAAARGLLPPDALVGRSVHDVEGALRAREDGADFVLVGTIFATPSHPGREGAGPALLSGVRARARIPAIAIGGVVPGRVAEVLAVGAHGIAALSGVWDADDPAGAVGRYLRELRREEVTR